MRNIIMTILIFTFFLITLNCGSNGPNVEEKYKTTLKHMHFTGSGIDDFISDKSKAPEGTTMADLEQQLSPFYTKKENLKDGWGNDLVYKQGIEDGKVKYWVGSGGMNGTFAGFDSPDEDDIIYHMGVFTHLLKEFEEINVEFLKEMFE